MCVFEALAIWPANISKEPRQDIKIGSPAIRPSIFDDVPPSCIPSGSFSDPIHVERREMLSFQKRSILPDELEEFNSIDKLPNVLSLKDFEGRYHNVNVMLDKKDNIIL